MSYEAWRVSYQNSEQAARAAWDECERLRRASELLEPDNIAGLRRAVDLYCGHLKREWKYSYTQGHWQATEGEKLLKLIDKAMRRE